MYFMNFTNLLRRIMDCDVNIRHSIITDIDGNILEVSHRQGVVNYLSEEETAASLKRAAGAWQGRRALRPKIGSGTYAMAAFEKITRITFPLGDDNLIFVSVGSETVRQDLHAGGHQQIISKVLGILSRDPTRAPG